MARRRAVKVGFGALALVAALGACSGRGEGGKGGSGGAPPAGLTPELAARVLVTVGGRPITLGDYAAALEAMNEFDRARYQTPARRRELLDELIDLELLALEAERRGLAQAPEARATTRQLLENALLEEVRRGLPAAGELPEAEVRAYYESHRDQYREPERRRVAAIALASRAEAERVLALARAADPPGWGRLFLEHGEGKGQKPSGPLELLGDLGIVGPPDDPRGDHPRVPPPLRAAVFAVEGPPGTVLDRVVEAQGKFYVVRLAGKSGAHERSFAESERGIRAILLQQRMAEAERRLDDELKRAFPITIDEAVLSTVRVPGEGSAAPPHAASNPPSAPSAPRR
ncbi:MAG TPA: peptidylprolyl isomerase [Polyangiaceae bacterium]|nr:peptidylprolyl isomerase [Polyangiaceae bacterium]